MTRHILLVIFRSFKRFKNSFFINLVGLSTGLTCALLIYLWVDDEIRFDKFHANDNQLYQVMQNASGGGSINTIENTPGLLAQSLAADMPEVQYAAAAAPGSWFGSFTLSEGDVFLKADGEFADKDFFSVFSYPLLHGDKKNVLGDRNAIVLSKSLAMKLFHTTENVVGKPIQWHWQTFNETYRISGIFDDVPGNSSMQFDFVLPWSMMLEKFPNFKDWGNSGPQTYVVLKEGTNVPGFDKKIAGYLKAHSNEATGSLFVRRYSDGYLYGNYENGVQAGGRISYVRLISLIAIFILVIACINFMNLSTAKATRRLKEVGIKKAIGAGRRILIIQYMGESLLLSFFSLFIAVGLALLLIPQFNVITGKHLTFHPGAGLLLFLPCIVLLTGLVAGSYPALYLSGFSPAGVLKGKLSSTIAELWARKGLVVFQFVLSVILIVSVSVVYKQIQYIQTKNLGYNKDNIIYFGKEGRVGENQDAFLAAVKTLPGVVNASSIVETIVGTHSSTDGVKWPGKEKKVKVSFTDVGVNYDMIETLGVQMKEGRSFSRDYGTDSAAIIFNEAAIDAMKMKDPIGKTVKLWGDKRTIIGVVRNFHFQSFHEAVKPLFFRLAPQETMKMMVKIAAGHQQETIAKLQDLYRTYNPGFTLDYKFLDQDYQAQYAAETRVAVLSRYFAGFAILISCLGLFGLVSFTTERRLKEIGIRKVLGSSNMSIIFLLSKDFTQMVVLSIVIALPVSYFLMRYWLNSFVYRIGLAPWFFISAGLVTLLIAWLTIGLQTIKAASVNPIKTLREE